VGAGVACDATAEACGSRTACSATDGTSDVRACAVPTPTACAQQAHVVSLTAFTGSTPMRAQSVVTQMVHVSQKQRVVSLFALLMRVQHVAPQVAPVAQARCVVPLTALLM
jgi:hypothetical protein